jgi:hypothetical protein
VWWPLEALLEFTTLSAPPFCYLSDCDPWQNTCSIPVSRNAKWTGLTEVAYTSQKENPQGLVPLKYTTGSKNRTLATKLFQMKFMGFHGNNPRVTLPFKTLN